MGANTKHVVSRWVLGLLGIFLLVMLVLGIVDNNKLNDKADVVVAEATPTHMPTNTPKPTKTPTPTATNTPTPTPSPTNTPTPTPEVVPSAEEPVEVMPTVTPVYTGSDPAGFSGTFSFDEPFTSGCLANSPFLSDGKLVICIDPGHDSTHVGACNDLVKEEELNRAIADACIEELLKYENVEVIETRDVDCPYEHLGYDARDCNEQRTIDAAAKGAEIFVSLHCNFDYDATASGIEVIYQNENYRPDLAAESRALGVACANKLQAVGWNVYYFTIRNSEDGTTYEDGTLADYYNVLKNSKINGMAAVIVEHGFLSNAYDMTLLTDEDKLEEMGRLDAKAIAEAYGLKPKD